jgi:hypothetical protein
MRRFGGDELRAPEPGRRRPANEQASASVLDFRVVLAAIRGTFLDAAFKKHSPESP